MKRFGSFVASAMALALTVQAPLPVAASPVPQDGGMWQVFIAGVPLSCTSYEGQPVRIYLTRALNNVGIATRVQNGQPIIVLNPDVMSRFSPLVQVWWFAHECGHHVLGPMNSESNADCWGVRVLRDQGFIRSFYDLQAFAHELGNLPGSPMGHLPGPLRVQNIINCSLT